jgi:hypothetical protein
VGAVPVFAFPLIKLEQEKGTGLVRWSYKHYRFFWDGQSLFLDGQAGPVNMATIAVKEHAVQFSLGFCMGRESPFLANEAIEIVG